MGRIIIYQTRLRINGNTLEYLIPVEEIVVDKTNKGPVYIGKSARLDGFFKEHPKLRDMEMPDADAGVPVITGNNGDSYGLGLKLGDEIRIQKPDEAGVLCGRVIDSYDVEYTITVRKGINILQVLKTSWKLNKFK